MSSVFQDFDLSAVWLPDEYDGYVYENYQEKPFTAEILAQVEAELGYKLPQSFIALMSVQNGGEFRNKCFPTTQENYWSDNHVMLSSVLGIGFEKEGSLCGGMGQKLWLEEWEYPPIGVYFANDPSGGHAMFALDYRECGQNGEPKVVLVEEQGFDYRIVELAPNFENFIRSLKHETEFDD